MLKCHPASWVLDIIVNYEMDDIDKIEQYNCFKGKSDRQYFLIQTTWNNIIF